ncbi:MAG: AAA family ATPase, partial [Planctomycetaceae bacterium]
MVDAAKLERYHDVVVIDDPGIEFRRWPSREAWPRFILQQETKLPEWLLLKLSSPVAAGDLWHTLVSGQTQDQFPKPAGQCAAMLRKTIAVISINDLRLDPIHVAKGLSWERTASDLARELLHNGHFDGLRKLRYVVVSLDTDGALIAEFPKDGDSRFRLVFDPGRLEGEFNASIPGELIGFQSCLAAAVAAHLAIGDNLRDESAVIEQGVVAGLCAMRTLLTSGHGAISEKGEEEGKRGFPKALIAKEILSDKPSWSYGIVDVPVSAASKSQIPEWTIVAGNSSCPSNAPLWGLARRVAARGLSELYRTPYLNFGKLFSVDRGEMESLRTLQKLLLDYRDDKSADKPLSIAVFGPPGAGKSFGVKQLAAAVFKDDVSLLEFNLSQFKDASELHGLFHQVRDKVLSGKTPIVFWDEFDTSGLLWLQYLLAPMQDGTFQEGQITHPIGKCVFVFAGGTSYRYEEFGKAPERLAPSDVEQELKAWRKNFEIDFERKKGPDFKSRLSGYLDVLGPNPRENVPCDLTYPVRRALLLRVHLKVAEHDRLIIDSGVLNAFLQIKKYRHGARSLQKIAEQLRQSSRTGMEFSRSDLPSRQQLDLHVDADAFLTIVESV